MTAFVAFCGSPCPQCLTKACGGAVTVIAGSPAVALYVSAQSTISGYSLRQIKQLSIDQNNIPTNKQHSYTDTTLYQHIDSAYQMCWIQTHRCKWYTNCKRLYFRSYEYCGRQEEAQGVDGGDTPCSIVIPLAPPRPAAPGKHACQGCGGSSGNPDRVIRAYGSDLYGRREDFYQMYGAEPHYRPPPQPTDASAHREPRHEPQRDPVHRPLQSVGRDPRPSRSPTEEERAEQRRLRHNATSKRSYNRQRQQHQTDARTLALPPRANQPWDDYLRENLARGVPYQEIWWEVEDAEDAQMGPPG